MMKAILGSALGGLAAGALALVASASGRTAPAADPWAAQSALNAPQALTVADARGLSTATTNAPTMVQCEPQQEAVTRRSLVAGREVAEVTCVSTRAAAYDEAAYFDNRAQTQSDIVTRPAVRTTAAQPRVVRQTTYVQPRAARETVEKKRSWKTTAMVIGGSAAGGAGIGALAGGKKGALIGAAVGGGAGTVYELIKRNK